MRASRRRLPSGLGASDAVLEQVRYDQEIYSAIVEQAHEGVVVADKDNVFRFANARAAEIFDVPVDELVGRTSREFLHPDSEEFFEGRMERAAAGHAEQYDAKIRVADGSTRWILVNAQPIRDSNGKLIASLALLADITERKRAEQELTASEERYRSIVETTQDLIWIADGKGRFTFVNQSAAKLLGYSADELLGKDIRGFLDSNETSLIESKLNEGRRVSLWRTRLIRKDGSRVDASINAVPSMAEDGTVESVTGTATDITHRREAERQRELAANVIRSSLDGIFAYDREYRITVWNPEMEKIAGMPAAEVLGRNVFEAFPFLTEIGEDVNFRKTLLGEVGVSVDRPFIVPEAGRHGFFDAFYSPLREGGDAIAGGLAIVRDTTARRRAEQALRDATERFGRAFEDAPIGMALVEPMGGAAGQYVKVNEAFCKIVGLRERDVLGRRWQDLTPGDDAVTEQAAIDDLICGRTQKYQIEKRYLRPDGEVVWTTLTASLARDPAGEPLYLIKHVEETTARRRANEAMRRLVATVESAEDAIYQSDVDHRIVSWNPAAERLYGWTREEAVGQSLDFLVPEHMREVERGVRDAALSGMSIRQYQTTRVRKDGAEVTVALTKSPVRSGGEVIGTATIAHDISAQIQSDRERADLEARLRQWERLESVGQLAGGVAHDFNNLLSVILNYTQFMAGSIDPDSSLREDLNEIQLAAERAAALTRQLLLFSRRQTPHPVSMDLNQTVSEIERLLDRLLEEDIELSISAPGDLAQIQADPSQLEQILVNLVINARDAMPKGGSVTVTAANASMPDGASCTTGHLPPGDYVTLSVRDTGAGISEEALPHIFEPFYTTKSAGQGTGLGLATVYGVVTRASGGIDVRTGNEGTEFQIFWPAAPEQPRDLPESTGDDSAPAMAPAGARILLVEDEPAVRAVAERILTGNGYDVLSAACGRDALDVCRGGLEPVDLVLSDVVMPGMSGPELARHVRGVYGSVPVVFMSGYTDDVLVRQGATPDSQLIDKPFSSKTLTAAIEAALSPQGVAS